MFVRRLVEARQWFSVGTVGGGNGAVWGRLVEAVSQYGDGWLRQ